VSSWLAAALASSCLALCIALPSIASAQTDPQAPAIPTGEAARLTAMGEFFDQSEPPSQDWLKARDLYCRAAVLGHPEALRRLGWLYLKGRGVAPSDAVAGTLFGWAAQLGDGPAAGLAAATPVASEQPAPCLAAAGITSLEQMRARAARPAPAPVAGPSSAVDNPAQFRATPVPIEQRRIVQMVLEEARTLRIDPRLVLAVMRVESGFDPLARSPKNAQGLMQLIPETAQRFNVADAFDPQQNVRGGMAYLRWLLAYYRGEVALAVAAYNAGEGAVDRFRGVPPYPETLAYVQRIRALYPFDRHPFESRLLQDGERSWVYRGLADAAR
jgi:soluble lytic murein transglycosylase-like protein